MSQKDEDLLEHVKLFVNIYLQSTAITKVIAGSMLLIAHEKVGEVNFNPA